MHCVGCTRPTLLSSVSKAVRLNSTNAPSKPSRPPTTWDDIVIPSRQEILKLKAAPPKAHKTDISYLKFESNASLAARLARPTLDLSEARANAEALLEETDSPDNNINLTHSGHAQRTPKSLASLVEQRREARLSREAEKAEREAHKAEREAKREARHLERTQTAINQMKSIEQLQRASAVTPSNAPKQISPLAAKRRAERLLREARIAGASKSKSQGDGAFRQSEKRQVSSRKKTGFTPQQLDAEILEAPSNEGSRDFEPEFKGPEIPLPISLSVLPSSHTTRPLDLHRIGDYGSYVPQSPQAFTYNEASCTYPPTQHVQMLLSHRRDVSIPKRKHALDIIAKITAGRTARSTSQASP